MFDCGNEKLKPWASLKMSVWMLLSFQTCEKDTMTSKMLLPDDVESVTRFNNVQWTDAQLKEVLVAENVLVAKVSVSASKSQATQTNNKTTRVLGNKQTTHSKQHATTPLHYISSAALAVFIQRYVHF